MTLYKTTRFVFAAFLFFIIYGCSNDENELAPPDRRAAIANPVVISPQPANKDKKKEIDQERSLKIGVIGPETGEQGVLGRSVMKGVLAAAGRFNHRGGIDGKDIEVLHYNTEDSARLTELAVRDLVRQKAIAIIPAPTGWSTFAPTHIVSETKTIFISIGSRRRIGRSGPYIFRASLPDELATDGLIKYATETLNFTDFALVTSSQYDYSLDLSAQFKQAIYKHGGTLSVDADTYDTYTGRQNLGKVLDAIKARADTLHGVIFTGGDSAGALFAQEMRRVGLDQPIMGGEDLFTTEYLKGKDAVSGSLLYATFSPHNESPKVVEFKQDYGKDKPDRFAALAYDTFMLIAQAIKAAGSTRTSQVRDAIVAIKEFAGATGKTSFTPEGTPVKQPFLYRVTEGEDGQRFQLVQ